MYKYDMERLYEITVEALKKKGVEISDIAEIVYRLQSEYAPITMEMCEENVLAVLRKRETIHAVLTALAIDKAVDQNFSTSPFNPLLQTTKAFTASTR